MKRMRFLVATLIVWLFLFYNIERMSKPVNITDVAYVFVPLMAAVTILVPHLRKVPLWMLLVLPIPVFLIVKAWVKSSMLGYSLTLTVTEICVIVVTTFLARLVSNGTGEFERAVTNITIGQASKPPESFSTGQAKMYREIRRARHHQRPLALMAIGVEKESIQVALDRMVQEVQRAMMTQYVLSDVAKRLCDELEDYNIIAQRNSHFLVLLPEVTSEQSLDLANRLCQAISRQVGVTLNIGTASFPEDATTFDGLVERAVEGMNGEREPECSVRPQPLAAEHHTI